MPDTVALLMYSSDIPTEADTQRLRDSASYTTKFLEWDTSKETKKPGYAERLVSFCRIRGVTEIFCGSLLSVSRGSIRELLGILAELAEAKIWVHILNHETMGPHKQLLALRNWERDCKALAQTASIERARGEGRVVGRPPKALDRNRLLALREQGLSYRQIGERVGLNYTTVMRRLGIETKEPANETRMGS